MNKKGYVFMIDVIVAVILLIAGLFLIYYGFIHQNKTIYFTERLSQDIIGVLSYTKINDLCTNAGEVGCTCGPRYPNLQTIVCSGNIEDTEADILSMISEMIENGAYSGQQVKDLIKEIFVDNKVIDEKRFGFAILYYRTPPLIELYNTETN